MQNAAQVEQDERPAASQPFANRSEREQAQAAAGGGQDHAQHLGQLQLAIVIFPELLPFRRTWRSLRQSFATFNSGAGPPERQLLAVDVNTPEGREPTTASENPSSVRPTICGANKAAS